MSVVTVVGMHEAKTNLSKLVERAEAGEEIVIARRGKPVVQLTPVAPRNRLAEAYGALRGQVWMADDFDDCDEEIEKLFYEGE